VLKHSNADINNCQSQEKMLPRNDCFSKRVGRCRSAGANHIDSSCMIAVAALHVIDGQPRVAATAQAADTGRAFLFRLDTRNVMVDKSLLSTPTHQAMEVVVVARLSSGRKWPDT
jgi:hypothetical protein